MGRTALATLLVSLTLAPKLHAQSEPVVLVLDAAASELDADAFGQVLASALDRPVVRMTDARAREASGQLSVAHTSPDLWVLRYERRGEIAWASEHIAQPDRLESRLAALTRGLVREVERHPRAPRWSDALALRSEIVDPFANDPRPRAPAQRRFRFSEVLDPFEEGPRRAREGRRFEEVLDPWAPAR